MPSPTLLVSTPPPAVPASPEAGAAAEVDSDAPADGAGVEAIPVLQTPPPPPGPSPEQLEAEERRQSLLRMRNIVPLLVGYITDKTAMPVDENGRWHGSGVVHFLRGHRYEGEAQHGMLEGQGTMLWPDGTRYTGQFSRSVITGDGTFLWPSRCEYKGAVCCGKRHGVGVFSHPAGYIYHGEWQHGVKHGKGRMFFGSEKNSTYDGDWEENQREGFGERIYPSGNNYSGEWRRGKREGQGKMWWYRLAFYQETYEGEWKDGLQHGQGFHCWRTHQLDPVQHARYNTYRGQFRRGERHGDGLFQYANDATFTGRWSHNFKSGSGEYVDVVQDSTRQDFIDDKVMYVCQASEDTGAMMCVYSDLKDFEHLLKPTYQLDMEPLLQGLPEVQQSLVREQVWTVLRRHISDLRLNYSYYAGLGTSDLADSEYMAMTQLQWWQMMRDCQVHLSGVPAQVLMGIPMLACGTGDPLSVVHFHQYLLMFLLLADVLYTSEEDWHLAERVGRFIEQVVLVRDAQAVSGLVLTLPLSQRPSQQQLQLLYAQFQRQSPCTVRTTVCALGNGRLPLFAAVRPAVILHAATLVVPSMVMEDTLDMELELTFIDFCELLLLSRKMSHELRSAGSAGRPAQRRHTLARPLYDRVVPTYALLQYKYRLQNALKELVSPAPKKPATAKPSAKAKKGADKAKSATGSQLNNKDKEKEKSSVKMKKS